MASIALTNVTKTFGDIVALDELSLDIADGEFFVILGHPGAGKTTTLRTIVGLERPDAGSVMIGGRDMHGVPPGERDVGIVFQNLALYPDKTVYENLAFPLRHGAHKYDKAEIDQRVHRSAEILRIVPLLTRKPARLSGGERQRVAIGRVMTREPEVYLLDEPLSALDALLRMEMRTELKRLQVELNRTLVYVTHDQVEAMSMADRICVLVHGKAEQVGTPSEVYDRPATISVARTVGSPPMNLIQLETSSNAGFHLRSQQVHLIGDGEGELAPLVANPKLTLGVRPEDIIIGGDESDCPFRATVMAVEPLGSETIVDLHVDGQIVKAMTQTSLRFEPDQPVSWGLHLDRVHLFNDDGLQIFSAGGRQALRAESVN